MAPAASLKIVIPSQVVFIDLAHTAAEKLAEAVGFDADEALNVGLAVRETAINAIIHGNCGDPALKVEITLEEVDKGLEISVQDEGPGFDPDHNPDPVSNINLLNTSGRGLLLVRAFVDEVSFHKTQQGMKITLAKHFPPDATAGPVRENSEE
jgi:serine/threonine-protein kinase RsbW